MFVANILLMVGDAMSMSNSYSIKLTVPSFIKQITKQYLTHSSHIVSLLTGSIAEFSRNDLMLCHAMYL